MSMEFCFEATLIEWRGPAPFVFAPIPLEDSVAIKDLAKQASYGWGCIAVTAIIGATEFKTSLIPKDGRFLLPVKLLVRRAENLQIGDEIAAKICINFALG